MERWARLRQTGGQQICSAHFKVLVSGQQKVLQGKIRSYAFRQSHDRAQVQIVIQDHFHRCSANAPRRKLRPPNQNQWRSGRCGAPNDMFGSRGSLPSSRLQSPA